jgi:hypothetical protein
MSKDNVEIVRRVYECASAEQRTIGLGSVGTPRS